jgi:RNA polymerase sigma factor (sigma-70 family)
MVNGQHPWQKVLASNTKTEPLEFTGLVAGVYHDHNPEITRQVALALPNAKVEDLEDILENVWLILVDELHDSFQIIGKAAKLEPYHISRAVGSEKRAYYRRRAKARTRELPLEFLAARGGQPLVSSPEDLLLAKSDRAAFLDRMSQLLDTLTDAQRQVIVLAYIEHRSVRQISQITGLSSGAVYKRIHDARKRLHKLGDRYSHEA